MVCFAFARRRRPSRSADSVARLLAWANRRGIPVTPRGAGLGYVGGCVPVRGGIVLSTERMNKILEINRRDFVAVVQPAVNTEKFQEAVERRGLFYPPDPASRADNFIGGNIATNAGGPRCLKYGVTRDYVLGLEVVLANGAIVRLGGRTHKNKTGFDLHRLFVGSEGLLGVITEATLKLIPLPPFRANLAVGFNSMNAAVRALQAIFAAGYLPCAAELADEFTLAAAAKRTGSKRLLGCKAHLIVELDGQENSVRHEIAAVEKIVRAAKAAVRRARFWQRTMRGRLANPPRIFLRAPRHRPDEVERGHRRAARAGWRSCSSSPRSCRRNTACPSPASATPATATSTRTSWWITTQPGAKQRAEKCLDEFFRWVIASGGAITGEHGIGLAKKRWWPLAASPELRELHHRIKKSLDPKGILNPGKFV